MSGVQRDAVITRSEVEKALLSMVMLTTEQRTQYLEQYPRTKYPYNILREANAFNVKTAATYDAMPLLKLAEQGVLSARRQSLAEKKATKKAEKAAKKAVKATAAGALEAESASHVFVYLMRGSGMLKPGYTTNLSKRLHQYGPHFNLLAYAPWTEGLEGNILSATKHLQIRLTSEYRKEHLSILELFRALPGVVLLPAFYIAELDLAPSIFPRSRIPRDDMSIYQITPATIADMESKVLKP